ncbi:hypothetical protein Tco_0912911 [Tanacetum coccineum]
MPWRHPDSCVTDEVHTNFNQDHVNRIKAHIVKLYDIPEGVLFLSGVSRVRRNPMCDPMLRRSNNTVTKADNAAKQKASSRSEVSTNVTKNTKSSKKGSKAGSSGQAAGGEVDQVDDDTLDDGDQRDDTEFAMEDIESLNDVIQDKEVEPHVELSGGARKTTRASFYASHGKLVSLLTSPLDYTKNGSDDNVDPYYEARVGYTAGDVLERYLFPLVPGPYYTPYPYDEGSGNDSPPYTKDD